jgi:hypothetical protein
VHFEREFRKGYQLEQRGEFEDAVSIYQGLKGKYPHFSYIAEERISYLKSQRMRPTFTREETDNWEDGEHDEMSPV